MSTSQQFLTHSKRLSDNTGAFNLAQLCRILHINDDEAMQHGNVLENNNLMQCPYRQADEAPDEACWYVVGNALDEVVADHRVSMIEGLTENQQIFILNTVAGKFNFNAFAQVETHRSRTQLRQLIERDLLAKPDAEGFTSLTPAGEKMRAKIASLQMRRFHPPK